MHRIFASSCLTVVAFVAAGSSFAEETEWKREQDLPVALGRAGMMAGVHHGMLIAGDGANFPGEMPWDGGKKAYYDEIFVIGPNSGGVWRSAGRLPAPRAYSAA